MSNGSNGNPNSLINILLVPIILALVVGGTAPWWFEPLKEIFSSNQNGGDVVQQTSATEDIPETAPENPSSVNTNTSVEKLDVSLVEVNNDNEFSSSYATSKIVDGNVQSYWRTESGSILDVVLDFHFDQPNSLNQIHIYATRDGGSYTQPVEIKLIFFDDSKREIASQTMTLRSSSEQWQEYTLEKVDNVSSVTIDLGEPKNNTARYITINEIRFYGGE